MLRLIQSTVINPVLRAELAEAARLQLAELSDTSTVSGSGFRRNTTTKGVWDSLWKIAGGQQVSPYPPSYGYGGAVSQEDFEEFLDRASKPLFVFGTQGDWRALRRTILPAMGEFMERLGHSDPDLIRDAANVSAWRRHQGTSSIGRAVATVASPDNARTHPLPVLVAHAWGGYGYNKITHVRGIMMKEVQA